MITVLRGDAAGDRIATVILAGVWAYIVLPSTIEKLTGSSLGGISEIMISAVTLVALVSAVVRARQLVTVGIEWLIIFVAPCVYLIFRDAYNGDYGIHGLSYIVIAVGLAAARPRIDVLRVLAVLTIALAVFVVLLGVLRPEIAIVRSDTGDAFVRDDNKAFFPSLGLLAGIFPGENNLAQFLALGLPLVWLLRRPWLRYGGAAIIVFTVLWTSSRGSIITVSIVIAAAAVLTVIQADAVRVAIERLAIIAVAVVCVALPLLGWPDDAFTSRASIWNGSLPVVWRTNPVFGLGSDWFTRMVDSGISPLIPVAVHGHNQFVHGVVTGGFVLVVLTGVQLGLVAWRGTRMAPGSVAPRRSSVLAALVLVGILVNCWLELVLGYVDGTLLWPLTFPVLMVLLAHRPAGADGTRVYPDSGQEVRASFSLRSNQRGRS